MGRKWNTRRHSRERLGKFLMKIKKRDMRRLEKVSETGKARERKVQTPLSPF